MTSANTFPQRLTKIDGLMRGYHPHLTADDQCYFIGEYTADMGYSYSRTNSLISNLKKDMDRERLPEWPYKRRAIQQSAQAFTIALSHLSAEAIGGIVFVPVPPSKVIGSPDYDDRLVQMLNAVQRTPRLDVRNLVIQTESTEADHRSETRRSPEQIAALYNVNEQLTLPVPRSLAIVDDMLTFGAHFKAMCNVLRVYFPSIPIAGLFLCRRVPPPDDWILDFV